MPAIVIQLWDLSLPPLSHYSDELNSKKTILQQTSIYNSRSDFKLLKKWKPEDRQIGKVLANQGKSLKLIVKKRDCYIQKLEGV